VDVGVRWTGVAVTDPLRVTARPLAVLDGARPDEGVEAVARIAIDQAVSVVVVGVPVLASGDPGSQAGHVLQEATRLEALVSVPVVLWEESYSSLEVARRRRARRDKSASDRDDAEAAAVMLEEWIAAGGPTDYRPGVDT
jgi:putative Holliday junction resolvase